MNNVRTIDYIESYNKVPSVRVDSVTVSPGQMVTIDLLANDVDPDGDALTVEWIGEPRQGTLVDYGDGTVLYTANSDATIRDWFEYQVTDSNGGTGRGVVSITFNEF